jgi:hypothetical protein
MPVASHCHAKIATGIQLNDPLIDPTLVEFNDWLTNLASQDTGGLTFELDFGAEFVGKNWKEILENPDL